MPLLGLQIASAPKQPTPPHLPLLGTPGPAPLADLGVAKASAGGCLLHGELNAVTLHHLLFPLSFQELFTETEAHVAVRGPAQGSFNLSAGGHPGQEGSRVSAQRQGDARRPPAPARPGAHLQEDGVGHGGVGMYDDGGGLVVPDLLEERGGVPGVIQHPDRECVLGDKELPEELL